MYISLSIQWNWSSTFDFQIDLKNANVTQWNNIHQFLFIKFLLVIVLVSSLIFLNWVNGICLLNAWSILAIFSQQIVCETWFFLLFYSFELWKEIFLTLIVVWQIHLLGLCILCYHQYFHLWCRTEVATSTPQIFMI